MKDDLYEWNEWMKLSEAQQEATVEREMASYVAMLNRMTLRERVSHHRRIAVESCRRWRRIFLMHDLECFRKQHRGCQIRLLKLRIWRATGSYPGEA